MRSARDFSRLTVLIPGCHGVSFWRDVVTKAIYFLMRAVLNMHAGDGSPPLTYTFVSIWRCWPKVTEGNWCALHTTRLEVELPPAEGGNGAGSLAVLVEVSKCSEIFKLCRNLASEGRNDHFLLFAKNWKGFVWTKHVKHLLPSAAPPQQFCVAIIGWISLMAPLFCDLPVTQRRKPGGTRYWTSNKEMRNLIWW